MQNIMPFVFQVGSATFYLECIAETSADSTKARVGHKPGLCVSSSNNSGSSNSSTSSSSSSSSSSSC